MNLDNNTKDIKLYSSRTMLGATFLGGPLAAGYLIGENFKAMGQSREGRISLLLGIASSLILIGAIFLMSESALDKIPRQLIPLLYMGITWGVVEWKQGAILKVHKESNNAFFSGWRAALVGLVSLVLLCIGIFGCAFLLKK